MKCGVCFVVMSLFLLPCRAGMVFNVCVGVKDLVFSDSSAPSTKFSLLLADTVRPAGSMFSALLFCSCKTPAMHSIPPHMSFPLALCDFARLRLRTVRR